MNIVGSRGIAPILDPVDMAVGNIDSDKHYSVSHTVAIEDMGSRTGAEGVDTGLGERAAAVTLGELLMQETFSAQELLWEVVAGARYSI